MAAAPKIKTAFTITKYLSWSLPKYISGRSLDVCNFYISMDTSF